MLKQMHKEKYDIEEQELLYVDFQNPFDISEIKRT